MFLRITPFGHLFRPHQEKPVPCAKIGYSMLSGLFPAQFFHNLPLFLLLTRSFTRFPIGDELILISKRQFALVNVASSLDMVYT